MPDVPTSNEAGLPSLQIIGWSALFLPKATPKSIVDRVNAAVDRAMQDESILKRVAELGVDFPAPPQRTPQALAGLVRSEIDKWAPVIRAAGVTG